MLYFTASILYPRSRHRVYIYLSFASRVLIKKLANLPAADKRSTWRSHEASLDLCLHVAYPRRSRAKSGALVQPHNPGRIKASSLVALKKKKKKYIYPATTFFRFPVTLVWLCVQTRGNRGDDIKEGIKEGTAWRWRKKGIDGIKDDVKRNRENKQKEREMSGRHPSAMIRKYWHASDDWSATRVLNAAISVADWRCAMQPAARFIIYERFENRSAG